MIRSAEAGALSLAITSACGVIFVLNIFYYSRVLIPKWDTSLENKYDGNNTKM
jgi:hypothetical protein